MAGAALAACGSLLGLDDIDYGGARDASSSASDAPSVDGSSPAADASTSDAAIGDAAGSLHDVSVRFDAPTVLAQGSAPQAIAVDDARLYWIDQDGTNGASVRSIAKDGTGPVATIATAQPSPTDIAVDDTYVYWSVSQPPPTGDGATGCLAMMAGKGSDAGVPTCVTSAAMQTTRMAITQSNLVLLVTGAPNTDPFVGFTPKVPGATFESVQGMGAAQAITATSSALFVGNANGNHIDTASIPGLVFGSIVCLNNCGNAASIDMMVDISGDDLLWVTANGQVFTESIVSSTSSGVLLAALPNPARRMARDGAYAYVTAQAGFVYAVPLFGGSDAGATFTAIASGQPAPYGVTVDANNVYWTNSDGTIRAVGAPLAL